MPTNKQESGIISIATPRSHPYRLQILLYSSIQTSTTVFSPPQMHNDIQSTMKKTMYDLLLEKERKHKIISCIYHNITMWLESLVSYKDYKKILSISSI